MDSGGVWAFPGTTKWQTSFFSNKHVYKITDLERGGEKNTSTKSQTWGGGVQKKSKQHLYKITNLWGGGGANNHFSHIYIFRIPFRVLLGSTLSISIFFAYFQNKSKWQNQGI